GKGNLAGRTGLARSLLADREAARRDRRGVGSPLAPRTARNRGVPDPERLGGDAMRNTKFGRGGLGTVSGPSAEEEDAVAGPLSASSNPGGDSRDAAPPVPTRADQDSEVADEDDPVTMPIVPSAAPSDVLSALSAPLPPAGFKGGRPDVVAMTAPVAPMASDSGWSVPGDLPP